MTDVSRFNVGRQRGAALILIVFILALAMTTYLLKTMNTQRIKVDHQQLVRERLNEAKQALLAWAVTNSENPGEFPYPDRYTGGGYDGKGDCPFPGNPFNIELLIGQLPIYGSDACNGNQTTGLGVDAEDGYGNRLWYAVSRNLVRDYSGGAAGNVNPPVNSDILNVTDGWLRVRDKNGNVVSDRVAAVIIAPGEAIGNQSQSNTAAKENYLDSFQKNGVTYSNSDYDTDDEDFIMGSSQSTIDDNDTSYTRPYLFNDQLVYITVDELMVALEKRVAREAVSRLNDFYNNNGYLPYASVNFANNVCEVGRTQGLLPFLACDVGNDVLTTASGDWFIENGWDDLLFYAVSSDCLQTSLSTPACSNATLNVGGQSGVSAVVISIGREITTDTKTQNRTSPTGFEDYLDSEENYDSNDEFDAVGTPLTNSYNDQMFIVEP